MDEITRYDVTYTINGREGVHTAPCVIVEGYSTTFDFPKMLAIKDGVRLVDVMVLYHNEH